MDPQFYQYKLLLFITIQKAFLVVHDVLLYFRCSLVELYCATPFNKPSKDIMLRFKYLLKFPLRSEPL
jgi:hypothetical protein